MEGVEYHVRAILEAQGGKRSLGRFQKFANGLARQSQRLSNVGRTIAGTTIQTGAMMGKIAAGTAVLAGAAGFGALVGGAIKFNAQLEESRYRMGATLQLFNHAAETFDTGMAKGLSRQDAAAKQFTENMRIAEAVQMRIFKMAAVSPASFGEAEQMFANMLPGARAVTGDMERILALQNKSLGLGLITGDFQTTGAQLSRILTGGAGAEMETWRQVLQTPIKEAAAQGTGAVKKLSKLMGDDLTKAFNQLAPEERLKLVEQAVESIPTQQLGKSFRGVASTIKSNAQILQKYLGESAFAKVRDRMAKWVGTGGLLDPNGETMKKLGNMATTIGAALGKFVDPFAAKMHKWIKDLADNWPSVIQRMQTAFNTGLVVAKLLLKAAVIRGAMGGGLQAVGAVGNAAGGAAGMVGNMAKAGAGAAISAAAIGAFSVAIAGLGLVFGGVAAYFITNWDKIVAGIQSGAIEIQPLIDAAEIAIDGFVRLGNAIMGGDTAVSTANNTVQLLTSAIYSFLDAAAFTLKVLGAFQFVWNMVQMGLRAVAIAFDGLMWGMLKTIEKIASFVGADAIAADARGDAAKVEALTKERAANIRQDAKDMTQLWNSAEQITKGVAKDRLAGALEKVTRKEDDLRVTTGTVDGKTTAPKSSGGSKTIINKMVVHQDLRNQDPDRVIGAFYRAVDKSVRNRTQSNKLQRGGT